TPPPRPERSVCRPLLAYGLPYDLNQSDRREATDHGPGRIELEPAHAELRRARACMMIVVQTLSARHPGEQPGVVRRVAEILGVSAAPPAPPPAMSGPTPRGCGTVSSTEGSIGRRSRR